MKQEAQGVSLENPTRACVGEVKLSLPAMDKYPIEIEI
jgi:hypothetical protein